MEINNYEKLGLCISLLVLNTSILFRWIGYILGIYLYGCFIGFIIGLIYFHLINKR